MSEARQRVREQLWPVLQQTAAATLSWWIAKNALRHHAPLFAPIATLVALNAPLGGRGSNAVRVVLGVLAGAAIGQLAYSLPGNPHPFVKLAVAVFCSLLVALVVDGQRVTMAQSAVSAVISVVSGRLAGIDRVLDVLLGAGVALIFSQLLFPANPLAELQRARTATLGGLARLLDLAGRAADASEYLPEDRMREELRPLYSLLTDLGKTRADTIATALRTPRRRPQRQTVQRESHAAAQLDLLGNSCLTLLRAVVALDPDRRAAFAPAIRDLSAALRELSAAPGAPGACRDATELAQAAVEAAAEGGPAEVTAAWGSLRLVARDIQTFARSRA